MDHEKIQLGDLRIDRISQREVLDLVFRSLADGSGGWLVTANMDFLQRASEDSKALELYKQADVTVADGLPLVWASWLKGLPVPQRVAGSDLIWLLAERAAKEGRSIYLLGGAGDVARKAAAGLVDRFPGLRIAGHSSPAVSNPPAPQEIEEIRRNVLPARPDILFAAFGSPKQEHVIAALRGDLPQTWMVGCGIAFSFVAGDILRAPRWLQRTGLEWLHRLAQEPNRLTRRYLVRNLPFTLRLLWSALLSRR